MSPKPKKVYILDTNVLIHDPQSMFSFAGVLVGIPAIVLDELDSLKKESTDRGGSVREVVRKLDALRARGPLSEGVKLDNGGMLQIIFMQEVSEKRHSLIARNIGDHEILLTALYMKGQGYQVTFISKDINARVKADVLGIDAEDYLKGHIAEYDIYKGWRREAVPANDLRKDLPAVLNEMNEGDGEFEVNEYVELQSRGNPHNYRVFRYLGSGRFKSIYASKFNWPLEPRNAQQLMTLDLLLDEEVQLVSLIGPAGTGKTFLALLAGLHQVISSDIYEKILVSRPVIPLGPDIGYLPGDVQEKLESWMQPVHDNMNLIFHSAASNQHLQNVENEDRGRRPKKGGKHGKHHKNDRHDKVRRKRRESFMTVDDLIDSGKISLEAITYMRGRSIPFQYILIDEVQNLTVHEVKTLITRVGTGSKIILAGDPYQIDSPYLDFSSNGLVVASNSFKGQKIFGTVFLEQTERSELSRLASKLL